jgi:hypothetical protein
LRTHRLTPRLNVTHLDRLQSSRQQLHIVVHCRRVVCRLSSVARRRRGIQRTTRSDPAICSPAQSVQGRAALKHRACRRNTIGLQDHWLSGLAAALGHKRLAADLKRRLFWGRCSLPLAILDESRTAKQPPASPLCGTLLCCHHPCAALHWLPLAAALPHRLRWILSGLASRIAPARPL